MDDQDDTKDSIDSDASIAAGNKDESTKENDFLEEDGAEDLSGSLKAKSGWPTGVRAPINFHGLKGGFEPTSWTSVLLSMDGKRGRDDSEAHEVARQLGVENLKGRPRNQHTALEQTGVIRPEPPGQPTKLSRLGRLLRDLSGEAGLERYVAREALDFLCRFQSDNPISGEDWPNGCKVHPYWMILSIACDLDFKIHWDEVNREVMRTTSDDEIQEVVSRISNARSEPGYDQFLGSSNDASGPLQPRAHPALETAPSGKTPEGQLRDQRFTPFLKIAGFGELLLASPGRGGGGYWTIPEKVRDIVEKAVATPPPHVEINDKNEWIEWLYEGTMAPTSASASKIEIDRREYPPYLLQDANTGGQYPLDFPIQRILHGCPGSGKSFALEQDATSAHRVIRTVFHSETRYSDFVGGLRPESIYRKPKNESEKFEFEGAASDVPGEPYVQYVVQPGPLLKAYHLACREPDASVVLIIEELSRAVAAHVFGDMLQLLDRRERAGDPLEGFSEYEIEPRPDIRSWINFHDIGHDDVSPGNMRFPPNLYIWATMNRSDQNARQLDSAFLRRWSKRYLSFKQTGTYDDRLVRYGGGSVKWGELRQAINSRLQEIEGVPEDKFVGPYFIPEKRLQDPESIYEDLWGYIWNDVLKTRASTFFENATTFAELQEIWNKGEGKPIGSIGNRNADEQV